MYPSARPDESPTTDLGSLLKINGALHNKSQSRTANPLVFHVLQKLNLTLNEEKYGTDVT